MGCVVIGAEASDAAMIGRLSGGYQTGTFRTPKRTASASATEMPFTVACIVIGASSVPVRW
jgi:hypothetical protein